MTTMHNFAQLRMQGISDPAHSMMNKGGGGSAPSNPDTRYANLDALYGTQNQASQFMLNNAMPYIPTLTQNSAGMVQQAMDGTLADQMRDQAGNNAQATFGAALDANNRNMQRYGMGMNANRMLSEGNRNAIMGAGMKAGEMNKAIGAAEDMKWNRNANFYGQVMGMNSGAMQGMSSAGAGLSNIANQQNANDAANARGYGQAGAAFSNALFKADGGIIEGKAARLASGGNAWEAYKAANPVKPMVTGGSSGRGRTNPYMAMLSGAAPQMLGAGLKDVLNLDGKGGKIAGGLKKGYKWVSDMTTTPANNSATFVESPTYQAGADGDYSAAFGSNVGAATEMGANTAAGVADAALMAGAAGDYVGAFAPEAATLTGSVGTGLAETAATTGSTSIGYDLGSGLTTAAAAAPYAKGGCVKPKRAQGLALGGMPSMQKMSVADNANVAGLDSNQSMSVARMGTTPTKQQNAKPTGNAPGYYGNTDGMGETSYGDEDGFGKYHGDYRHMAGKATMQAIGSWLGGRWGGMAGSALAEVVHPIAEPLSRAVISTGDRVGGVSGALLLDPIGSASSGKYTAEEQLKGHLANASGMPWLSKFFSQGGDVEPALRKDFRPGGKVTGPGTETSDSIPAWLSSGEFVLNSDAVKMVGKDKLEKINNAGLKRRKAKAKSKAGTGLKKGR